MFSLRLNNGSMYRLLVYMVLILIGPVGVVHAETQTGKPLMGPPTGWSFFTRGGYLHQFEADIDDGGSFSVNRFTIQVGPNYTTKKSTGIGLAMGYGFDGYDFSGSSGFGGRKPWDDIHTIKLSIPVRWKMKQKWSGFISPTVRSTGEKEADLKIALPAGGSPGFPIVSVIVLPSVQVSAL